jgi:exodeoxyribonuclease VIII
MKPGGYADIPNDAYHGGTGISKSGLDKIAKTPAHYYAAYLDPNREPREPTKAMILGSAYHALVLEPEEFKKDYAVAPEGIDRRSKEGKAFFAEMEQQAITVISETDFARLNAMHRALMSHPAASKLLAKSGRREVSFFWDDPETGELCKCRPDFLTDDGYIIDLKTTDDASPAGFGRSCFNYRYHVQHPWYQDGCRHAGIDVKAFVFLAQEKEPPYAVGLYVLEESAIDLGRQAYQRDLSLYADCRKNNHWPSYNPSIVSLSLPNWAMKDLIPTISE